MRISFAHWAADMQHVEMMGREWMAVILALLGISQIVFPRRYCGMDVFFKRAFGGLTPEQSERLRRVLEARRDAEGVLLTPTRYTGLLGIAMAALGIRSGHFVRDSVCHLLPCFGANHPGFVPARPPRYRSANGAARAALAV